MRDYQAEIHHWHRVHFGQCSPVRPLLKSEEELGEVCRAYLNEDVGEMAKECGDVLIALYAFAARAGFNLDVALSQRWDEIQERTHERVTEQHRRPPLAVQAHPAWENQGRPPGTGRRDI